MQEMHGSVLEGDDAKLNPMEAYPEVGEIFTLRASSVILPGLDRLKVRKSCPTPSHVFPAPVR